MADFKTAICSYGKVQDEPSEIYGSGEILIRIGYVNATFLTAMMVLI